MLLLFWHAQGVVPPTPPTPDTHDSVGFIRRDDRPSIIDRTDRAGLRAEIDAIIFAAREELPNEDVTAVAAALREEILRPTYDPALLAGELQKLTAIADITQNLYDLIQGLAIQLYREQDDEEALLALLHTW